jgi:hypothetical protein
MSSWAATYTVKDESFLLGHALPLLEHLGCERVYLYLDGTSDDSERVARAHSFAEVRPSLERHELTDPPDWCTTILPRWEANMDVRKRINCLDAARKARAEGIEWLACIDVDELIVPNLSSTPTASSLRALLDSIAPNVDQVLVPNFEAIPEGIRSGAPFATCTLFARRFPATELLIRAGRNLLRRAHTSPKALAEYEELVYRARFPGAPLRTLRDPRTGERIPAGLFLGYRADKSLMRTSAAVRSEFNIHRWQKAEVPIRTVRRGCLLHYDICSPDYLTEKFRKRPPAMLVPAFHTRHLMARLALDASDEVIERFFLESVCVNEESAQKLLSRGIVERFVGVQKALDSLGIAATA